MTKGDDAVTRRKNKAKIKKLNKKDSSSNVSARVAAMIAAKKRRQSGKRRKCQGMCFSLPTPDDPFNDRHGKPEFETNKTKKRKTLQVDKNAFVKGKSTVSNNETKSESKTKSDHLKRINEKVVSVNNHQEKSIISIDNAGKKKSTEIQLNGKSCANGHQGQACRNLDCPSKFLILCLNAIENALHHDVTYNFEQEKRLSFNSWGIEFWKCYSSGKDILETGGSSSTIEQIAWMVSTAADSIARKEKEGFSLTSPFLLYLIPSQEKAAEVRSVCKPLKALGIHTVSLHPGAALDHQIKGLKSCEPEFLVSTPERLLELVSLKAIDISGVSLLVVDGLGTGGKGNFLGALSSIRQSISGKPHTMVFNDCLSYTSVPAVQNLLPGSIYRLSLNNSVASQSACIIQSINVCTSEEEKLLKGIQVLDHAYVNHLHSEPLKVLYVVGKDSKFQKLVSTLKFKGYSLTNEPDCSVSHVKNSVEADGRRRPVVSVIDKAQISTTALGEYEVVIIPDFILSVENYVQILTSMARHTVMGMLHSLFTKHDVPHVEQMIEILEQCGQIVPEALRDLCPTSPMLES